MTEQNYIGEELSIFAKAVHWKNYYASIIQPYIGKRVVEVGAGIGATTQILCDGTQDVWICLEPDKNLLKGVDEKIASGKLPRCCSARAGIVQDLDANQKFDTLIYIDVLEHIEHDRAELRAAAEKLSAGGHLIVLSPAYNFLYSPFDKTIGHYRRYDKKMIRELKVESLEIEKLIYLDAVGALTSMANRLFLKQSMPTEKQILFWDQKLVPLARVIDPLMMYSFGRSIVGIWKKRG